MSILDDNSLQKLKALKNQNVLDLVNKYIEWMQPSKIYVITDDPKDINFVRQHSLEIGEEASLEMKGHTIHYDGYNDQGRDRSNTRVLVTKGQDMSKVILTQEREEGIKEVMGIMKGIMKGKEMIIRFFVLGPKNSTFSICAFQITDSWYVGHSEDLLYRNGYEEFKKLKGSNDFFKFIHSAGELENSVSKNVEKRRIFMDLTGNTVYTVNNQYAGNSLGLKKLALRLAIYKANNENWLTEHMFIMGVQPVGKNRITYVMGAYPSACGKTSTAMIPGQTIVGDDIAYIHADKKGNARSVNIEQGIFGIIQDVNQTDDPVIYKALTTPREVIFSNVLVNSGKSYWVGMGKELPKKGKNHSGEWEEGKKDSKGAVIPPSHPNSRFTLKLSELENVDRNLDNPDGVIAEGIFYGGRDSDTTVPVLESLSWEHGVFIGATIESETTAATVGKVGVREASPMANLDFLVVPLGKYLENHRKFGKSLKNCPKVFATNYFLKINGKYCNEKVDKKVWILWAEGRIHSEYQAIKTPVGHLPKLADLQVLFKQVFNKIYSEKEYVDQFSLRIAKLLEKLDRMEKMYKEESNIPQFFWDILTTQRKDLIALKEKYGKEIISPLEF
jgi:phosphoenolpyruvate carboxykinase (GTP)